MDNNKDTLIISSSDNNDINIKDIAWPEIQTLNFDDLIQDLSHSTDNSVMIDSGGTPGQSMSGSTLHNFQNNQLSNFQNTTYANWNTINNYTQSNVTSPVQVYTNPSGTNGYNYIQPFKMHQYPDLTVEGDAEFNSDIKWKGRSLGDMLDKIERRLSILVPNPEKLEHYEALKKAYEHYKTLEALCDVPSKEKDQ